MSAVRGQGRPGRPVARWHWGDDPAALADLLAGGGLVGIPSESSYGLAADPANPRAVDDVFRVKGRSPGKPLPVVAASAAQLAALGVRLDGEGVGELAALWPAALTLVLPLAGELAAAAGGPTLAVRVPDHPRLCRLLEEIGPVTATSANPSGGEPLLDPDAVAALLAGRRAAVVDDGTLAGGPPSTLVDASGPRPRVLRAGRYPPDRLASLGISHRPTS